MEALEGPNARVPKTPLAAQQQGHQGGQCEYAKKMKEAASRKRNDGGKAKVLALNNLKMEVKSETSDDSSSGSSSPTSSNSSSDSDEEEDDVCDSDLDAEEEVDQEVELGGDSGLKDLIFTQEKVPPDASYIGDWTGAPSIGSSGFNRFAARVMWNAGIGKPKKKASAEGDCPSMQPHQEAVAFLLHPQSPISRLLVDHPTGSGKTREMIKVLDNYYLDPRPKVPIFPKEPVCRNFYVELLRWPSRYRDFFACLRPQDATRACGHDDWRSCRSQLWDLREIPGSELKELCSNLRAVLEMKGWFYMGRMRRSRREAFRSRFPDEEAPAAPLRALRYTSAGGRHADLRPDGWPVSALLKVAFNRQRDGGNAYSNKVVIMDEVHNLVRSQTQYAEQLAKLRSLLSGASGTVLAGFTGTPILNKAMEGRQLLDIIKGASAPRGDGGFLSSFPMRPAGLFPTSLPRGVPDALLTPNLRRQFVRKVTLLAEPLKRYDAKRQKGLPERRLRAYCNLCVHFGSLHDGKNGSKARVLANMEACAPKLYAIATDVVDHEEKALVLVARNSGLLAFLEHLKERAATAEKPFHVATIDELAEFNSPGNLGGELFRVLVADAAQCSEGVSFFAVRRLHLADVPVTPSALVQSVGRAIRMYGHKGLLEHEQTVTTTMWVAVLPRWMRSPLSAWAFRAQKRRGPEEMELGARRLLRSVMAAGLKDLPALKARIDSCGGGVADSTGRKAPLTPFAIAAFLEQIGMWEEAKVARQRVGSRPQGRQKQNPSRGGIGNSMKKKVTPSKLFAPKLEMKKEETKVKAEAKVKKELPPQKIKVFKIPGSSSRARQVATPQAAGSSVENRPLAALLDECKKASGAEGQPKDEAQPQHDDFVWERDPLIRALQCLYCAESATDAEKRLHLSPWSADEEALKNLSHSSREFVPALEELRKKAVDRAILLAAERRKKAGHEEVGQSEGESSAIDFSISDHNGEDGEVKKPFLPVGWRTETFRLKGRERREYIDPHGKRYRTLAEAKKAIDAERTRQNIANLLKQRVAKMDALAKIQTDIGQQELTPEAKADQNVKRQKLT